MATPLRNTLAPLVVGVDEAAALLGADASQVRKWVADGLLPSVRYPSVRRAGESSRRILLAVSDLTAFVTRHRVETPQTPDAALSASMCARWRSGDLSRGRDISRTQTPLQHHERNP
ncbi:MAG: helix-turn-helix domain-containing protein [Acidobacteria bacterium]|nr:helix-turn-helix domain-containing protein [Acidobacteriota bacterium]